MKQIFCWLVAAFAIIMTHHPAAAQYPPTPFVHPGLLQSREDLERMKEGVAARQQPLYSGYELFIKDPASGYAYKMQGPMASVGRNPTIGQGVYDGDANAAYQCAIMWCITGDTAYAAKAKQIVNAWSYTLKSITGRDAVLMAGLGPFKMVNAAELLRYTNTGWPEADILQAEKCFKQVVYPVLKDFAPFANGNWDAAAIKTVMAIGVFCDDRAMFERALRHYVNGSGNGRLTHYVINDEGQIQESGRDQQHTQLGIGLLGDCCEIAWHQGLDLYGYADNRLLKGFEYTARYNLGNEVPFTPDLDRTGKYSHKVISTEGRGRLRAVYEEIYNHYVNRMGLSAPYTSEAAAKIRPEGPGRPGADHTGYGTLLYTVEKRAPSSAVSVSSFAAPGPPSVAPGSPSAAPAPPGALIATGAPGETRLTWVASVSANRYTVKRAPRSGGPYRIVASALNTTHYMDRDVHPGRLYYYTVSAANAHGESGNAYETGICAGLPFPWKQEDIGVPAAPAAAAPAAAVKGLADFNGTQYTMEATGHAMDSTDDECHFLYKLLKGDGGITVRFCPQPSSQSSEMGLMMRESAADNSAHVSLLLNPGKSAQVEAPDWNVQLITREGTGAKAAVKSAAPGLTEPYVTYGRLTGYTWLRLVRKGENFTGYISPDGQTWTIIGSAKAPLKKDLLMGIPVCSGIAGLSTTVQFDNLSAGRNPVADKSPSPASTVGRPGRFPAITARIQGWIDSGYYSGASLIIVKDDRVRYQKYFGHYNPSTVAHIASAGKWLAAATIAAVVDEGWLNWDDPVVKWLPSFTGEKGKATLRQLLSHTSGYPDYQPPGNHPDDYQTLAESVAHIRALPSDTTPGSLFHYGGLAMQVAGRMAELATGKDWETLFQEKIAAPLHMANTHFTPVDSTGGHNPMIGGGARCTLDDYAHFLDMISHDGIFEGKRILSRQAIREMESNQVGAAEVRHGEYVERARGIYRRDIYGLGEWREETDASGNAVLLSSPSWAGAYPWIDKVNHIYGFFLARVNVNNANRAGFSAFYASPVLPMLARQALNEKSI